MQEISLWNCFYRQFSLSQNTSKVHWSLKPEGKNPTCGQILPHSHWFYAENVPQMQTFISKCLLQKQRHQKRCTNIPTFFFSAIAFDWKDGLQCDKATMQLATEHHLSSYQTPSPKILEMPNHDLLAKQIQLLVFSMLVLCKPFSELNHILENDTTHQTGNSESFDQRRRVVVSGKQQKWWEEIQFRCLSTNQTDQTSLELLSSNSTTKKHNPNHLNDKAKERGGEVAWEGRS